MQDVNESDALAVSEVKLVADDWVQRQQVTIDSSSVFPDEYPRFSVVTSLQSTQVLQKDPH